MDNLIIKKDGLKSIKEIKIEKNDNELKILKIQNYMKMQQIYFDLEIVDIKDLNSRDDDWL